MEDKNVRKRLIASSNKYLYFYFLLKENDAHFCNEIFRKFFVFKQFIECLEKRVYNRVKIHRTFREESLS